LGLMYLAAPLIKAGYIVKFVDFTVDRLGKEQYLRELTKANFVLISCYSHALNNVKKIIHDVRRVNQNASIICGGPYCSDTQNHIEEADVCVFGEADLEIVNILDSFSTNKTLDMVPGLSFLKNGKPVRTGGTLIVDNLDMIEPPSLSLSKDKNYGHVYGEKVDSISAIISSRGCPYKCTFCTGQKIKYRERSIDNIIQEIRTRKEQGAQFLVFYDDNFMMKRDRVIEIMDRIIENKFNLKIAIQGRVDLADIDLYMKMKDAGVIIMLYGIESANQDVLDFYRKMTTVEKIKKAIKLANKVGFITFGNLIIGAPIEKKNHFEINKRFLKEVPLDLLSVHILHYTYPSPIWIEANKKGLIGSDEIVVAADDRLSNFSKEELIEIQEEMVKSFYNNTKRILRLIHKVKKNLGTGFVWRLLRIFSNQTVYRTAERFHGFKLKNVRK
jgi:anaerobic magnesium-protoporphyrin IX monomethyl ester cyclase